MGYVLPVSKGLRLRDLHYIKIFLIALVFSLVTVFLPVLEQQQTLSGIHWIILLERCLFLLAITLPFDIRDLQVDRHHSVKTIPQVLGTQATMRLALLLLGMEMLLLLYLQQSGVYSEKGSLFSLGALALTAFFIYLSPRQQHDYYFSGLLDGTMLLLFLASYLAVL